MPNFFPTLLPKEHEAIVEYRISIKEQCGFDDADFQFHLQDSMSQFFGVTNYFDGFLEALQDISLHNPIYDAFQLSVMMNATPDYAQGYREGIKMAREILKQISPERFKKRPPIGAFDSMQHLR